MSETITVTFGGREVVLTLIGGTNNSYLDVSGKLRLTRWASWCGYLSVARELYLETMQHDSPQAAATALESKLRALRDQLSEVLGQ